MRQILKYIIIQLSLYEINMQSEDIFSNDNDAELSILKKLEQAKCKAYLLSMSQYFVVPHFG